VCDQDEAKASNRSRDWEPIWVWEFCPIVIPLMESELVSHPTFYKTFPIFHHVRPLMPIKIYPILKFSISPAKFVEPMKSHFDRSRHLSDAFLGENSLHHWARDNFHDIFSFQETFPCLLHHSGLDLPCDVFIIKKCQSLPIELVEPEVAPL
jgi:hypothetical protein